MPISVGNTIEWDCQSEVYCPMMGNFYNVASTLLMIVTNTNYKLASEDSDCDVHGLPTCFKCNWTVNCPNGNGICGLVYNTLITQQPITMPCENYNEVINIWFPDLDYCLYDLWSIGSPVAGTCF